MQSFLITAGFIIALGVGGEYEILAKLFGAFLILIGIGLDYIKDSDYWRFVIRFLQRMGYAFINDLKKVEK